MDVIKLLLLLGLALAAPAAYAQGTLLPKLLKDTPLVCRQQSCHMTRGVGNGNLNS